MPTTWSKASEVRVEHVAHAELDRARAEIVRRALARQPDQRRREIDGDDVRATPRRLDREGPGAAARVEQPRVRRDPSGSQPSNVRRIASRPARTVARMPLTGASEVSRVHASAAVRSK